MSTPRLPYHVPPRTLAVAIASAVALALAPAAGSAAPPGAFAEPFVRASKDGVLTTTLVARAEPVTIGGRQVRLAYTFEHSYPGPTLAVQPGDRVDLTLVNKLPEATNLAFDGLQISPAGDANDVLRSVPPGQSAHYVFTIPKSHPRGLYWYHAQLHGAVERQVYRGLAGLIVVGNPLGSLPALRGIKRRLLLLQSVAISDRLELEPPVAGPRLRTILVDGRSQPTLTIRPGELQLWRVANGSDRQWFDLRLDSQRPVVVGEDGHPAWKPWPADHLLLPPGKRFEILVKGGAAGSLSTLRTLAFDQGRERFPAAPILTLLSESLPVKPIAPPESLAPVDDLAAQPISGLREFTLSAAKSSYTINSRAFDPARVDTAVRPGALEEWTLHNTSAEELAFHVQGSPFEVIRVGGKPAEAHGLQDTVRIPRSSSVTIRVRFGRWTGKAVYLCPIALYQDRGMMGLLELRANP